MGRLTRLHQVAAKLTDIDAATEFYRDRLGARMLASFDPPGLVFFDFNGTRLLLERAAPTAVLYFRVDDIHAAFEHFKRRGVIFEDEPHLIHRDDAGLFDTPGTEEWMVFFKDPAGNTLALADRRLPG